jgi:uncharacterized protein (DUF2267 family)
VDVTGRVIGIPTLAATDPSLKTGLAGRRRWPIRTDMSLTSADTIERSVHKTNEWLKAIGSEPGIGDREDAWRILRAYLELIREQLNLDEAAQLSAQLPLVIRGAFWEGFDPGDDSAKLRDRQAFLARFAERAQLDGAGRAERAAAVVTRVLRNRISEGELEDVLSQLPAEVREALHA